MADKLTADRLAAMRAEFEAFQGKGAGDPAYQWAMYTWALLEHIEALEAEKRPEWVWVVIPGDLFFNREEDARGVGYYDKDAAYAAAESGDEDQPHSNVLRVTVN